MRIRYFDNAASSWPKPAQVAEAMKQCVDEYGANPGRGSHSMAVKASRILFETRKNISKLLHVKNPNDISFALNTTGALNLAIQGFLREGDHVICSNVEHNSVRRPLEYLRRSRGVSVSYTPSDSQGNIRIDDITSLITAKTKMIVCSHSSNLLGTVLPIEEIAELCHRHGIKLLVDAAQTAGTLPLDIAASGIHMLAFPGHKGLLGPQGTGGLYIAPDIDLEPLLYGGTGSQSEEIEQPTVRPDRYEAGTQNTAGIAGLNEGVKFVLQETVEKIHHKEWGLTQRLMEGLLGIDGVAILGPDLGQNRTGIVSFNLAQADSSEISFILDQSYQIAVRAGYHCSPLAHECAGTLGVGAVRASIGYFTTESEVDELIAAVKEISQHYAH
ncbi:aminotransferase class V-fold PLP-dependent enzyme [Paenibacillus thalictri]|uniref:cysteine desulfurase n=1 Tax=Paenibacillus thalictri TaxID=2527873 RepID=A0A4Q9DNE1_9BACL|nr:aminotransferase class V-fold PLP-dependent enzyme [Paenibacillus thalictri]TBL77460.1 aminotransferase class V-fold PLP-dependent enzyme [Paenibacillus thalictri]